MYWRSSGRSPSGPELLACLGLLPAGLSGALLMLRGVNWRSSKVADEVVAGSRKTVEPMPSSNEAMPSISVISGSVNLPAGSDPAALLGGQLLRARPALNGRFRDDQDLPLRISAMSDLDEYQVLDSQQGTATEAHERRAIALLEPVLEELLDSAMRVLPASTQQDEVVIAGLRRHREVVEDVALIVEVLVPGVWSGALQRWLQEWIAEKAEQGGLARGRCIVRISTADSAEAFWPHLLGVSQELQGQPQRMHLLAGCFSGIDSRLINGWLSQTCSGISPQRAAFSARYATGLCGSVRRK